MSIARGLAERAALCTVLALFATALVALLPETRAWAAPVGGISALAPDPPAEPAAAPHGRAMLVDGRALAPIDAPATVRRVIAAANRIRTRPYIWGGGHGRWWDRGYDCSGSVSFALHGGEFLTSPLPSGPMEKWGLAGEGRWITVYANGGNAYAVIAGV